MFFSYSILHFALLIIPVLQHCFLNTNWTHSMYIWSFYQMSLQRQLGPVYITFSFLHVHHCYFVEELGSCLLQTEIPLLLAYFPEDHIVNIISLKLTVFIYVICIVWSLSIWKPLSISNLTFRTNWFRISIEQEKRNMLPLNILDLILKACSWYLIPSYL